MLEFILLATLIIILKKILFVYTPKNCEDIYKCKFADGGIQANKPANTTSAYLHGIKSGFSLGIDIRPAKDGIVCAKSPFLRRITNVPGSIKNKPLSELTKLYVANSKKHIPSLDKALNTVAGQVPILFTIYGKFNKKYKEYLSTSLKNYITKYNSKFYFQTYNLITYFKLKKIYGDKKVFFMLNPFRKKFKILRAKDYKRIDIPDWTDLVITIEENDKIKNIINKIWSAANKYHSRITKDHPLFIRPTAHRGIITRKLPENSKEAFELCARLGVNIEADFFWLRDVTFKQFIKCSFKFILHRGLNFKEYKNIAYSYFTKSGEVRCFHKDGWADRLGQKKSCADKIDINNSISLKEFLKIIDGRSYICFDIKDFSVFSRKLEKAMIKELESYTGKYCFWSFNFIALDWTRRHYKDIERGQIGNSISSLKGNFRKIAVTAITFIFFYIGKPDIIVYDYDKYVYLFSKFQRTVGLPIAGYQAADIKELEPFDGSFDVHICEDMLNRDSWHNKFNYYFTEERKKIVEDYFIELASVK